MAVVDDRGFFITLLAIRRQLAAMPNELYLVRLIHHQTRKAFPGERPWMADQLASVPAIRFLRVRNREGCDIYLQPYAEDQNAGYILVDLDRARQAVIATMRSHGHAPCITNSWNLFGPRRFSCRGGELSDGGLSRCENGRDDFPSSRRDLVAVSARNFLNDAVSA